MKTWDEKSLFASQASYYAKFRRSYPAEMFTYLRNEFHLTEASTLLDLGCGTGQVSTEMAHGGGRIIGADAQPAMLDEAKKKTTRQNIDWVLVKAEEISSLGIQVNLTVMARSFHWMEREKVLKDLYDMTVPGGGVAIIGDKNQSEWYQKIEEMVLEWTGAQNGIRKIGASGTYQMPAKKHEDVLRESSFKDVSRKTFVWPQTFTADEIIGRLYSLSYCSVETIGDKKADFEQALRSELAALNPVGKFQADIFVDVLTAKKLT